MKIKNLFFAIYDQLTRKGAWRNIFVTHNAFGIFSRYSHTARGSGKQKMSYPTKAVALRAAKAMSEKHGGISPSINARGAMGGMWERMPKTRSSMRTNLRRTTFQLSTSPMLCMRH